MDSISDAIIRIKNAQAVRKERVLIPFSKMKAKIAGVLKDAGFILDVERRKKKIGKSEHEYLDIVLRYDEDGRPGVTGIKIISKPSRHLYIQAKDLKLIRSGYGIAVLSTSNGIMSSKDAFKQKIGGEMLFEIW